MDIYKNISLTDLPNEEWRDISIKEGYMISSLGRVKSLARTYTRVMPKGGVGTFAIKEKIIKCRIDPKQGYVRTSLGKGTKYFIHRLVASAFIDNPEDKKEVNHIDFNRSNNRAENLEWALRIENIKHTLKAGRRPKELLNNRGANHVNSKRVNQYDLKGNLIKTWDCVMDIIRHYGYGTYSIYDCMKRNHKQHGGFKWEYVKK